MFRPIRVTNRSLCSSSTKTTSGYLSTGGIACALWEEPSPLCLLLAMVKESGGKKDKGENKGKNKIKSGKIEEKEERKKMM